MAIVVYIASIHLEYPHFLKKAALTDHFKVV